MSSIEKRTREGQMRWVVRYRDPAGKQRTKTFLKEGDAKRHLTVVDSSILTGSFIDPARSMVKVAPWAADWLAAQTHLKPSTRARYAGIVDKHIVPRWGTTPLAKIGHADVQTWVAGIDLAPRSVLYVHRVFALVLELAVRDGRLQRNPATGVRLPKAPKSEKRFLDKNEVFRLADAAGEYRPLILTLAYCGLRWGEMAALRAGRVDLLRGRVLVAESVIEVAGRLTWGTPKSHAERLVPVPRFVCDALAPVLAGKGSDDLVFTTARGKPLRNLNFRRDVFDGAADDAGLAGLTPHELRHTSASLAVSAGANVKSVQRLLGHASAAMTLDVYSGLFDTDLDALAARLDASVADVSPVCTEGEVVSLPLAANDGMTRRNR